MCLIVIKRELALNAKALLTATTNQQRLELLNQRSNLKDMLIEILEQRTKHVA